MQDWQQQNWSGHVRFSAARVHSPRSIEELQALVRDARKAHVIGSRHCFHDIADTDGDLLWLGELQEAPVIDAARRQVTIHGGMTYEQLCPLLEAAGWALPNLPSLKHVTVVGACMTSTHGSGDNIGQLATAIKRLELVQPDGSLRVLERGQDGDDFRAAAVSIGALGIVARLSLDLVPSFQVQQDCFERLSLERYLADFDAISGAAYSVSAFTTWQQDCIDTVWLKRRLPSAMPASFHGATAGPTGTPPTDRTLTPCGQPGAWHERLPHYAFHDALAVGNELQSEYFVDRDQAGAAIRAVVGLRAGLAPILGLSEVRTMAADDLWLSCTQGRPTVGLHFNWLKKGPEVEAFLPTLEAALAPMRARPHLGKLFAHSPAQLASLYPRWRDLAALARRWDPAGKFSNAFLERHLFSAL
jgi:xylitol oxidase